MGSDFLIQAVVYLASAIICVPLAKKLGMGSVLGYLIAGILIGPFLLGLTGKEGEDIMAEAGNALSPSCLVSRIFQPAATAGCAWRWSIAIARRLPGCASP